MWPFSRKSGSSGDEVKSSLDLLRLILPGARSVAGKNVNWQTALRTTVALACVRVISEGIAQVPWRLMRSDGRFRTEESALPLGELLRRSPNETQTSFEFREQIALHLALCGNAFVFKNYVRGNVVELLPFTPGCVTVLRATDRSLSYRIALDGGESVTAPASQMWHIRGLSWNGYTGMDVVGLLRDALGLAMAAEEHGGHLFSNGARPGGILTTDSSLTRDQINALRESWEKTQGGAENAYRTAILHGGLKWQSVGMQSDQAEVMDTRKFQIEEVCRGFRVMPIMVGYSDKTATYASVEQMLIAHVVHTLTPWYVRIEQSADMHLLTKEQRAAGYYTKLFSNALLRGASGDRANFYRTLYGLGAICPNEIRELEDMNPYDGGDQFRVPLNMTDPNAEGK